MSVRVSKKYKKDERTSGIAPTPPRSIVSERPTPWPKSHASSPISSSFSATRYSGVRTKRIFSVQLNFDFISIHSIPLLFFVFLFRFPLRFLIFPLLYSLAVLPFVFLPNFPHSNFGGKIWLPLWGSSVRVSLYGVVSDVPWATPWLTGHVTFPGTRFWEVDAATARLWWKNWLLYVLFLAAKKRTDM